MDWFNLILYAVTVFGFGLAVWQLFDAKRFARDLVKIRDSLSTRYIDEFPSYIPQIIHLIGEARHEIVIVCDVPGYGYFSDYKTWIDYRNIIARKLAEKVSVKLICLNQEQRLQVQKEQFARAEREWAIWMNSKRNQERLDIFKRNGHLNKKKPEKQPEKQPHPTVLNFDMFIAALELNDQRILDYEFFAADIREITTPPSIYFWLVDGTRAVFTIPTYSEDAEIGFITSDQKLISAFNELIRRYVDHSILRSSLASESNEVPLQ